MEMSELDSADYLMIYHEMLVMGNESDEEFEKHAGRRARDLLNGRILRQILLRASLHLGILG